jgi:hypothetical protein
MEQLERKLDTLNATLQAMHQILSETADEMEACLQDDDDDAEVA